MAQAQKALWALQGGTKQEAQAEWPRQAV